MKLLISAVAVATLVALPAFAQTPRERTSPNAVIFNGKVIGQDPDPAVRSELLRDYGWQKGGEYK
jgi:hypothetical protein